MYFGFKSCSCWNRWPIPSLIQTFNIRFMRNDNQVWPVMIKQWYNNLAQKRINDPQLYKIDIDPIVYSALSKLVYLSLVDALHHRSHFLNEVETHFKRINIATTTTTDNTLTATLHTFVTAKKYCIQKIYSNNCIH